MPDAQKYSEEKRFLKRFEIVETDIELPVQSQVRGPEDLHTFLHDLKAEQTPKLICVYLDEQDNFLGHKEFLGASAATFEIQLLYRFFSMFLAKKYIVLTNHPGIGDSTPEESDRKLMRALQTDAQVLSFKPYFEDYIIVGSTTYFSMATQDGTACRCGHQEYIPGNL